MNRMRQTVLILLAALLAPPADACTAFLITGRGVVLGGNNEDYTDPDTRIWFYPAEEGIHGRVYFGFGNGFPQGGMNDQGLFFDGFALAAIGREIPQGMKPFPRNPMDHAMKTCATVAEVVAIFEQYDLGFDQGMYLIGDKSGDAALLERGHIVRKKKKDPFFLSTNFRQSITDPEKATCPRYQASARILKNLGRNRPTVDLVRRALDVSKQKITLYSNVYDLKKRDVVLYLNHDFDTAVTFNLDEELKLGQRSLKLPEFFAERADGKKKKKKRVARR